MAASPENTPNHDPHDIEGVNSRSTKKSGFPWFRVSFFILVCGLVIAAQGPLPRKIWNKIKSLQKQEVVRPSDTDRPQLPVVTPDAPEPTTPPRITPPTGHTISSEGDIRKMSRGFNLETKVSFKKGKSAAQERVKDKSYTASYELKVTLPEATKTMAGLQKINSELGNLLPGLKDMLPSAEVSPFFYQLYENKAARLKQNMTKLNELMTRHNFYDCETILNLKHPSTGRRVLLVQAEMDVVSDGSDGDRLPSMPDNIVNSTHYQPMTSYGWKKRSTTPNPLIVGWKNRIKNAEVELARSSTSAERSAWLKKRVKKIRREIEDMEARSYLIADYDPFIVMPINMILDKNDAHAAQVGDYAVVVYQGQLYPCIVGDAGPSFKVGEASLRMAKQLNSRASSYSRPVSDLTVTYIVFPKSADRSGPPDYAKWHKRCAGLLTEVGGLGASATLHTWENTLPVVESTTPNP